MKIGIALSGGGYRAAVYHLGTLRKLKELGILNRIAVLSSNSGGSITAACYSLMSQDYQSFESHILSGVRQNLIYRALKSRRFWIPVGSIFLILVLAVLLLSWPYPYPYFIIPIIGAMIVGLTYFQFRLIPLSPIIEDIYNDVFFSNKTLNDFTTDFKTVISSTNLSTGRPFTFSGDKMGDSQYEYDCFPPIKFKHSGFPVAKAVMASTNVPGVFTPIMIPKEYYQMPGDFERVEPCLVDGGVFDNQGIHKVTFPSSSYYCDVVIVSDAGTELPSNSNFQNSISLLRRTGNVFMERIKNFQMQRHFFAKYVEGNSIVAYQSLSFDVSKSIDNFIHMLKNGFISEQVISAHGITNHDIKHGNWNTIRSLVTQKLDYDNLLSCCCTDKEIQIARAVSTNLTPLKDEEVRALMKHAMAITEIQVRLFCPHIIQNHTA